MLRTFLAVAAAVVLSGCGGARDQAIESAISAMRSQVASDVALTVDPGEAQAFHQSDDRIRYAVCGIAELHRPSEIPEMHLDRSRQRFVSLLGRSGAGITTFEGRATNPEFASLWQLRCR